MDRGSEYCGNQEYHEDELEFQPPQTNGICERFQKTVLDDFCRLAFRTKVYRSIEELREDLDLWLKHYNEERPHSGRYCYGKPLMETFLEAIPVTREKVVGDEMMA